MCVCIYVFITVFNRNRLTRVYNVRRQAHIHTRMHTRLTIQVAGELFTHTHTHTHALLFTFRGPTRRIGLHDRLAITLFIVIGV